MCNKRVISRICLVLVLILLGTACAGVPDGTLLIGWHTVDAGNPVSDDTPDDALKGVTGMLSGGEVRTDGESTDGDYGGLLAEGSSANTAIGVRESSQGPAVSVRITNNTGSALYLGTFHADYSRWFNNSPQDVTLYYESGDLANPEETLINTVAELQVLGKVSDYDDFDWSLSGLDDIVLANGESATFRLEISNYASSNTSGAFDNIAISAGAPADQASALSPADGAGDVPIKGVVLSWAPSELAGQHDVYFGSSLDAVNAATTLDPMGPDSLYRTRQGTTHYAIQEGLDFGQTYYWRIDEVNATPDKAVIPGEVWRFTIEPVAIPIDTAITATASGFNPGMEPSKTIDGSGLNELDQHSTVSTAMWLSGPGTEPVWIQYEFDKAYKLHEMWVWNSNQTIETFIGFGAKEVTIETSIDGTTWTALEGIRTLAKGTGSDNYSANTTVDLQGAMAKYVKLNMVSAYGTTGQFGLSEVRFMTVPILARDLLPVDGTVTADVEVSLNWRAGREAAVHEVKLGTDPTLLAVAGTPEENVFVTDNLDYAQTYYWQVIEVNEAETPPTHASEILSFSTPTYGTVDDFESYSGDEDQEVFMTWFDGFGGDASLGGSTTGHINGPFVEIDNVYDGSQSMPIFYANDGSFVDIDGKTSSPSFSEVVRDFDSPQDWTASGIQSLSIMFSGTSGNTGQLYCKIGNTKVLYDGAATDLALAGWQAWNIDLSTVGGLTNVRSLAIGVDGAGASGVLTIDEIRLFTTTGETITPVQPSTDGLVAHYPFDGDASDSLGQNHGTLMGTPFFVPGSIGQALQLDGAATYVAIDNLFYDSNGFTEVSVATWISTTEADSQIIATFDRNEYWRIEINGEGAGPGQVGWDVMTDAGQLDHGSRSRVDDGEWHHIAGVFDNGTSTIYVDGSPEPSVTRGSTLGSGNVRYGFVGVNSEADVFDGDKTGNTYIGNIDDLRIYHRALSAAEIAGLAGRTGLIHQPL